MPATEFKCPRRAEGSFGPVRDNDYDPSDDSCSYCGSLNPITFMLRLENGDVDIGSTDKNYKVYVHNKGGESFKQTFRDCPRDSGCKGPHDCTHWVTRETPDTKFYFQHLDAEMKTRFVELHNANRLSFQGGYRFYVLPFFYSPVEKP